MTQPSVASETSKSSRIDGKTTLTADTSMTTRKNTKVVTPTASQASRPGSSTPSTEREGAADVIAGAYPLNRRLAAERKIQGAATESRQHGRRARDHAQMLLAGNAHDPDRPDKLPPRESDRSMKTRFEALTISS